MGGTMRWLLVLAALAVGSVAGCDRGTAKVATPAKTPSAPVTELEGVWDQVNGHKVWRWEFRGFTLIERTGPTRIETGRSAFMLKMNANPAQIDWGEGLSGIFKLEGDTLAVCHSPSGRLGFRPSTFADDDKQLLYIFKRTAK
jgi:uncharacterized protein (TIGR03067 family)